MVHGRADSHQDATGITPSGVREEGHRASKREVSAQARDERLSIPSEPISCNTDLAHWKTDSGFKNAGSKTDNNSYRLKWTNPEIQDSIPRLLARCAAGQCRDNNPRKFQTQSLAVSCETPSPAFVATEQLRVWMVFSLSATAVMCGRCNNPRDSIFRPWRKQKMLSER